MEQALQRHTTQQHILTTSIRIITRLLAQTSIITIIISIVFKLSSMYSQ